MKEKDSTRSEKMLKKILEEHLNIQTTQDDDEDEQQSEQSVYSIQNAQQALQVLIEFTECQADLSVKHIRALEHLETGIESIRVNSQIQSTLNR